MKKIILAALTLAMLTSGCKVFKSSKKSENATPQTETVAETKVFSVPAPATDVRPNPTSDTMYTPSDKPANGKPVSVRSENFTLSAEDQAAYGNKNYFVIVGSFSSNENAGRFKQELSQQGFKPIVLHSETGYYRVCVDSFNDEASARSRVQNIRTQYPKYADSWLLIRK
ncbi:MAG TPA: SPOR domain-containing protein [Prolixibacteraceae bacterium]|nr:SPOR domain-containing protein [Prolixibacteraceae bacterium]